MNNITIICGNQFVFTGRVCTHRRNVGELNWSCKNKNNVRVPLQ